MSGDTDIAVRDDRDDGDGDDRDIRDDVPAVRADLLLALEEAGTVSITELRLPDSLSVERYEAVGRMLGQLHSAARFWIGDWLAFGERHYGPLAAQLSEALGISADGRMEYMRVSLAIPPERRRPGLSWSHHRRVAARWLTPEQRERLLDVAEADRLASNELAGQVEAMRERVALEEGEGSPAARAGRAKVSTTGSGSRSVPAADCADLVDEIAAELRNELLACGFPVERLTINVEAGPASLVAILDGDAA